MIGLSDASIRRLEEFEAKAKLESYNRGELRAMAQCKPTGAQLDRIQRLLTPPDPQGISAAFERGEARARADRRYS